MKRIFNKIIIAITLLLNVKFAIADTIQCDSENIRITGEINSKYKTMGHYEFNGELTILQYERRVIKRVSKINVFNGDIQDDISIRTSFARDNQRQQVNFNILQDRESMLQIGVQQIKFLPHCEIRNEKLSYSKTCTSQLSLGFNCKEVSGRCICHQHNSH